MKVEIPSHPPIPESISRLRELSFNLWWSWHSDARELFRRLDRTLWRNTQHNPVAMLRQIKPEDLARAANDRHFLALYESVLNHFDEYLNSTHSWYWETHPEVRTEHIAYFCAEFGIHNSLPIYSGGLGLLAGDTCKEASDLGIPMVGIGSLYPEGYFHQFINADGSQEAIYSRLETTSAPLLPVLNDDGSRLLVTVPFGSSQVSVAVWRVQVGRVPIYLMDTDIEENAPWLRDLSARLYGGDQNVRLRQEVILGMGGVQVLRALGYHPAVFHLNEGHAAFAGIQLLAEKVREGTDFEEAIQATRAELVFTTHTPVKAGHDEFPAHMLEEYFSPVWKELGINREQFLSLGQLENGGHFSMTVLALRLSRNANGVSEKHGEITREMWHEMWPEKPVEEVPIISVTNGVHVPTWVAPELAEKYDRYIGPYWWFRHDDVALWEKVQSIPGKELWETHADLKAKLLSLVRNRARSKWTDSGVTSANHIVALGTMLDPDALTLGFARRFATYKRAGLLLYDMDRLSRILKNPWKPVQIIFSGKAHPADEPGKFLLQRVFQACQSPELAGHVAFVEDYNKHIAHYLVSGVDVWLNNPLPPMEASGTSGQKAALNGVPNLSVMDGWWYEGYNGLNGWAIEGNDDRAAAESLYAILEDKIVPLYYERDTQGIPGGWVDLMREAIRSSAARFSARRMLKEYTRRIYHPSSVEALG